jgi:hypothetical protein
VKFAKSIKGTSLWPALEEARVALPDPPDAQPSTS